MMRRVVRVELHCGLRVDENGGEIGGGGLAQAATPPQLGRTFPPRAGESLLGPGSEADHQMKGRLSIPRHLLSHLMPYAGA